MATHPQAITARETKKAAAEAIGIDEAYVGLLVESFYSQIRADAVLGPIFGDRIVDWPEHLGRMRQFWMSVLHNSGTFSGNPMLKHVAIPRIEAAEFDRWLAIFDRTLSETAPSAQAHQLIMSRATMIADSLLTGIRIHRDGKLSMRTSKGNDNA